MSSPNPLDNHDDEQDIPVYSQDASSSLSLADVGTTAGPATGGPQTKWFSSNHPEKDVPIVDEEEQSPPADTTNHNKGDDDVLQDVPVTSNDDSAVSSHTNTWTDVEGTMNTGVRSNSVRNFVCTVLCIMTLVAVIVSLSMTLPDVLQADEDGTPTPVIPVEDVIDYLVTHKVSPRSVLETNGSPQRTAALWLAQQDSLRMPVPTTNYSYAYTVRYVLTLLAMVWDASVWVAAMNFLTDRDTCRWNGAALGLQDDGISIQQMTETGGIVCDANGVPRLLDMEFNNIQGSIPTELGLLTTLSILDLEFNQLTGDIPTELCQMEQLEILLLRGNDLQGPVPECLWQLPRLRYLDLRENQLSGALPQDGATMCAMTQLEFLLLRGNRLEGPLPTCLGALDRLSILMLSDNDFVGPLPTEMGQLSQLEYLGVADNALNGNPINTINRLRALEFLYLGNNQFTGAIGSNFVESLTHLGTLEISNNSFTLEGAGLPLHLLTTMPNLTLMDLSNNPLHGTLPEVLAVNTAPLVLVSLNNNQWKGPIPDSLILNAFSDVVHLDLSHNEFSGTLPNALFENEIMLNLFVGENPMLTPGPVPSDLQFQSSLRELSLKNTNRNGPLPKMIDFEDLVLLDFDDNDFTGTIPTEYSQLISLRYLMLNENRQLSGPVPDLTDSSFLQVLLLDGTNVYGDFAGICRLHAFNASTPYEVYGDDHLVINCESKMDPVSNTVLGEVLNCECCHCCNSTSGACSDPIVSSLDWSFRQEFHRRERDFQINETQLLDPERATDW